MARRITAVIGMMVILALAAVLVWQVYLHHESTPHDEEIVIVSTEIVPSSG